MIKLWMLPILAIPFMGCADMTYYSETPYSQTPEFGCVIISDELGEREMCDIQYYVISDGVIYWDTHFECWIGPNRYYCNGRWYRGFHPGHYEYYHNFYRPRGFYHSNPGRGSFHFRGGFHGGHR